MPWVRIRAGRSRILQLVGVRLRLTVSRTQREYFIELLQRSVRVVAVRQGDREIKVIVRIAGIGGDRLLKKRPAVFAAAARGHSLIVDDLRQRQPRRHKGERILRLAVVAGIEVRQAAIEVRLQRVRIIRRKVP